MKITTFQSLFDPSAPEFDVSWSDLVASLTSPTTYPDKSHQPLIKLATFGAVKSPKGMLRHDQNVTAITGVELDYDGEEVPLTTAAERLKQAGVECFLYTSASHEPDAPRWRVLLPLAAAYPPEYRTSLYEAVNSILGDICAPESATLSQAFYVGRVQGVPYEALHVPGAPIDTIAPPAPQPLKRTVTPDVPAFRKVPLDTLPLTPDTVALITNRDTSKGRHSRLMLAANALARAHVPPDDILCILADPDNGISDKALEKRSIPEAMEWLARYTVAKALAAFPPPSAAFAPLGATPVTRDRLLYDFNEIADNPRPIRWLIRDILEQEAFAVFFGPPGAGKSLVAVDMALSIASGTDFHGRPTTPGAIVYVSGEGFGGFPRRLRAWKLAHPEARVPPGMFRLTSRSVRFREQQSLAELATELDAIQASGIPIAAVFVDTYARANAGGNENNPQDASVFVGLCDRIKEKYKCTVALFAHTKRDDSSRLMGSQVITGAADVEMGLTRVPNTDKVKNVSVLKCTKMKDAEPFPDIYFQLKPVALNWFDPETLQQSVSWTFEEIEAPQALKRSESQVLFARCLGTKPIAYDKVRESFMQLYPSGKQDTRRKAWDRLLAQAIDREWCKRDGENLVPSPPAMYRDGIDTKSDVAQ